MKHANKLLFMILLAVPAGALATDDVAENHLVEAAIAYRAESWDAAYAALKAARAEAVSNALKAKIERQWALVLAATDRPVDALEAFREAVALDPEIDLEAWRFGPGVTTLFECAKAMPADAPRPERLKSDGQRGWLCPLAEPEPVAEPAEAEPEPVHTATVTSAALPEASADGGRTSADVRPAARLEASADGGRTSADVRPDALLEAEPQPPSRLGALGGVGIGLVVAGLGVGGGLAGWQLSEAGRASDEVSRLDGEIQAGRGGEGVTASYNQALADEAHSERNAVIAAAVGGAGAVAGVVLLVIDLVNGPSEAPDEAQTTPELSVGPGGAALRFEF